MSWDDCYGTDFYRARVKELRRGDETFTRERVGGGGYIEKETWIRYEEDGIIKETPQIVTAVSGRKLVRYNGKWDYLG